MSNSSNGLQENEYTASEKSCAARVALITQGKMQFWPLQIVAAFAYPEKAAKV